jgi:hypothetical protein
MKPLLETYGVVSSAARSAPPTGRGVPPVPGAPAHPLGTAAETTVSSRRAPRRPSGPGAASSALVARVHHADHGWSRGARPTPGCRPAHTAPAPGAGPVVPRCAAAFLPPGRIGGEIRHERLEGPLLLCQRAQPPERCQSHALVWALPPLAGGAGLPRARHTWGAGVPASTWHRPSVLGFSVTGDFFMTASAAWGDRQYSTGRTLPMDQLWGADHMKGRTIMQTSRF